MSLLLLILLAAPSRAAGLGGHEEQSSSQTQTAFDQRRAVLEEMWQRRLLPPDQRMWSPEDYELLEKIRRAENDALSLLKRKFGGYRSWTARLRRGQGVSLLTKEGYGKYIFILTQEAIDYFESRGADAKWVFKLKDLDGRSLFDGRGAITEAGAQVYRLARQNQEVFWRGPDGAVSGTRRPPGQAPSSSPGISTKSP